MRYFLFILILILGLQASAARHRYRGEPRSEVELMNTVLGCLSNKDSLSYFYLFPSFDSLWSMVMNNRDASPDVVSDLNNLKAHPQMLLPFDPYFNHSIITRFVDVLQKGEDSGIHWDNVVMQRYQLVLEENTSKNLVGYSRIVPERFKGYMFVRDLLGRLTFCISITEIQKIHGHFYGGQVLNILQASSIDEFVQRETDENKYFDWLAKNKLSDTTIADSVKKISAPAADGKSFLSITIPDDDSVRTRKEVVERRYYEGKFDEDIPVKLFIRYMKDFKTGKVSAYDGLYKFGDQRDYVRLNITKEASGTWLMEDDVPIGTLELELANKVYTGSWTNNENQTGYDVVLTQTVAPEIVIEQLDRMLETGTVGRADENNTQAKPKTDEVVIEGMENSDDAPRPAPPKPKKEKKEKQKSKDDDDDQ